jgi:hypothetical protein
MKDEVEIIKIACPPGYSWSHFIIQGGEEVNPSIAARIERAKAPPNGHDDAKDGKKEGPKAPPS